MDLQKTKILLDKINRLHQGFLDSKESISKIEKNLMLDYLSTIYDAVLMSDINVKAPVAHKTAVVSQPVVHTPVVKQVTPTPKVVPVVQPVAKQVQPIVQKPVVHPDPTPKPVVQTTAQPVQKVIPKTEPVVQRVEPVRPVVVKPEEEPKQPKVAKPTIKVKATQFNTAYDELFLFESAGEELSEKLANKSIKSIKKALGINEKYLISNELFGGDNNVFQETINQLDSLGSYNEARTFLEREIIGKFGWDEPNRLKRVKSFLKLLKSRYNS